MLMLIDCGRRYSRFVRTVVVWCGVESGTRSCRWMSSVSRTRQSQSTRSRPTTSSSRRSLMSSSVNQVRYIHYLLIQTVTSPSHRNRQTSFASYVFRYAAHTIWNSLSAELTVFTRLNSFKSQLNPTYSAKHSVTDRSAIVVISSTLHYVVWLTKCCVTKSHLHQRW